MIFSPSNSQIETTEYIDKVFELKSKFGTPNLTKFEDLVNKVNIVTSFYFDVL